jgi:AraC-like DNA-binding protein
VDGLAVESALKLERPRVHIGRSQNPYVSQHQTARPVDESVRALPAEPLRDLVAWYSGYRQEGVGAARHRGLPSPYMTLIVTLDDPLTISAHADPRQAPGRYTTLLGGLHTSPAEIVHDGRQSGIQVALNPIGARALLGLPAGELTSIDVHADEVLGRVATELQERVREAPTWRERFAIVDQVLLRRLVATKSPPPEVLHAWRALQLGGGLVSVRRLVREVGWSSRHLQSRFREEVGLTPKAAGRVIRFDIARRRLQNQAAKGDNRSLADLAAHCGYFDQAHLARDFRDLAGLAPSRWLAEEFRNVQVPAAPPVAEWAT